MEVVPPEDAELEVVPHEPPPRSLPVKPKKERTENSGVARQIADRDEANIRDWLTELTSDVPFKVVISRRMPQRGPKGENIAGSLETVDGEHIDEDYIRENWGGGTFNLQIMTMRADARYKLLTARQIKIAGPPRMHGRDLGGEGSSSATVAPAEDSPLAERAFETMERTMRDAQRRADHAEKSGGFDVAALRELQAPMLEQMRGAQQTISDLQAQIITLSNKEPPRDPFRDQMLQSMIGGERDRVETLRATYESRMDKMRENYEARIEKLIDNHNDEIKRLESRHNDEVRRLETRHERELKDKADTIETRIETTKSASETRIDALKSDVARLERELGSKEAKIGALEARKDQTIGEKADELIKVKEALDGIGGDGDGDDKWWKVALDTIGNSEAAIGFVNRLAGGPPQNNPQQQQPQQQLPPPGVPFQTGDGNVYVRDEQGHTRIIGQTGNVPRNLATARKKKKQGLAQGSQVIGQQPEDDETDDVELAPKGRPPSAKEVKMAIAFMENAIKSNRAPEDFARSARNMIPNDILSFVGRVGMDKFLNAAGLDHGSPLTSVRGRQFARSVARILLEGEDTGEPAPTAPAELEPEPEA